ALPWVLSALAMIAGTMVFLWAGGIWFDLAEANSPAATWSWLTGGAVLLAATGFFFGLLLASNALVRHPGGARASRNH
ncbi:MAG: hypothetical protein ACTHWA_03050, partial [Arachnia sp.]